LALENEAKLFELARLQNALLHSVPLAEYNRMMGQNKKLLRDRFLQSADGGYFSATEEETAAAAEEQFLPRMDITRAGLLLFGGNSSAGDGEAPASIDGLLLRCRRLEEMNNVLEGQNEALRNERRKMEAELAELNTFLDDLEAETELKSMCR
jgi:hypothetical protein